MPTTHLNGIDLYYERRGAGPRLLFINGSGATLANSGTLLTDVFTPYFDVIAYDQRGLGLTTLAEGPYTMADYASDAAALAASVGWDSYRVIGVSFGGMVAQELAVTVPDRIERLVLACTSSGGAGGSSYPLHTLSALEPADRAAVFQTLLDTRFTNEWLAQHPGEAGLVQMIGQRDSTLKSDDVLRGEALQLEARSHLDVFDRLSRITCPTLVACGEFDGIAPLANGATIAAQIPNAELRVFSGGHAFFAQDATAFPEIIAFLSL